MALLNLQIRPIMRTSLKVASLLVVIGISMLCDASYADDTSDLEYRVKSAFLYNFTKFIEWPETQGQLEFVMCVAGNDALYEKLIETVGGKTSRGLAIKFNVTGHLNQVQNCQLVYLRFSETDRISDWVAALSDRAILTVSDNDNFIKLGGMIQLLIDNGKIRFDINRSATNRADLKVSSKLLGLARNVN